MCGWCYVLVGVCVDCLRGVCCCGVCCDFGFCIWIFVFFCFVVGFCGGWCDFG